MVLCLAHMCGSRRFGFWQGFRAFRLPLCVNRQAGRIRAGMCILYLYCPEMGNCVADCFRVGAIADWASYAKRGLKVREW
jgi:hypothetical protein